MKIIVHCRYHNSNIEVDIPIDCGADKYRTCETDDVVKIIVNTNKLKTGRVEKIKIKQWRGVEVE